MEPSRISQRDRGDHAQACLRRHAVVPAKASFPQPQAGLAAAHNPHSVAMTCAQMAIIPKNSANEANAAASSTMTLNMTPSRLEQTTNLVVGLFPVKRDRFACSRDTLAVA